MTIKEFRVALSVEDFERATAFYLDGLGLDPGELRSEYGMGQMFFAGRAVLEFFDPEYARGVDQIEVGERVSGQFRFAIEVEGLLAALKQALDRGATLVHEPVLTPWKDLNARIQSPEGLQITLYHLQKDG